MSVCDDTDDDEEEEDEEEEEEEEEEEGEEEVRRTFSGLRSRCAMWWRWRYSKPWRMSRHTAAVRASLKSPAGASPSLPKKVRLSSSQSRTHPPSTNSSTMNIESS